MEIQIFDTFIKPNLKLGYGVILGYAVCGRGWSDVRRIPCKNRATAEYLLRQAEKRVAERRLSTNDMEG
tara:strand:+ start:1217 stop:1423 length:207 start_codon:yes stop_codon:yes gene_type:complete